MPRALRTAIPAVAVVLAVAWGAAGAALAAPDELIVRFEPGLSAGERGAIRDEAGTALRRALPVGGIQLLEVAPGTSATAAERALEAERGVLYAEPNATRRTFLRPNDPYFGVLWAMENTGQSVFGVSGSPDADTDAADAWDFDAGGGVVVAVVDTGVDANHPDLTAKVWRNPGESGLGRESNRVDDDDNGRADDWRGWDFVANDSDPADPNGHGTHVAGTIGALRNNALGVAGVAAGSRLMALRVFDSDGAGTVANAIAAYAYAARAGARIVNLSYGSPFASRAEQDAIAANPGVLFVAASGNGGSDEIGDDNDLRPEYPCAYTLPNLLCVAASDSRDRLASFSNYGARSVDLAAPGVDIVSTWPGGRYSLQEGTSMAAPHVTGAAALLWGAVPGASAAAVGSALLAGADRAPQFSGRTAAGGRLNVLTSLRALLHATRPPPPPAQAQTPARRTSRDRLRPRLRIRVARRQRLGKVLRRGLAVRIRCSERCTVRLRLRAGGRVVAGAAPSVIPARAGRRIVMRIRRAARARLRAAPRVTLVVRAADRSGNTRTATTRVRLLR